MGLFNIFKKKPGEQIAISLTLEQLLQKSAAEPSVRVEFYKRLLADDLVVITQNSGIPHGSHTLQKNTSVNLVSYPDGKVPVFTSTDKVFDKGVVKEQVEFLKMKGRNLFELAKGATFLLNPYSDHGKELVPEEIEDLLNGTIFQDRASTMTIAQKTEVQIGQPAKYPTDIVHSLKNLFTEKPDVIAAYLGWIYNPESKQPPHYIFAIETNGDLHNLAQEAGYIAKQFLGQNECVDFIQIDAGNGISDYFLKQTEPFYKRQKTNSDTGTASR